MKLPTPTRFLTVYSGVLTAAFVTALLTGFDRHPRNLRLAELTVERINVVEPDGTLRLILSNKARTPGIYIKGEEHLPGMRNTAGLIFLNDEGTENGGLTFSGNKDENGNISSSGHLSFDRYMQDQVLTMDASQSNDRLSAALEMLDRPDWPITELLDLLEEIADLPPEEQQEQIAAFLADHPPGQRRLFLGRNSDESVALQLKDTEGRNRIVMAVAPDGTPRLQFLDADGQVISQFPQ